MSQVGVYQEIPVKPKIGSIAYFAALTGSSSRKPVITPNLFQRSVAVGTLLGDSHLTKTRYLQVEHSTKQAGYLEWKHSVFADVAGQISDVSRTHSITGGESASKRFYTNKSFKDLEPLFYRVEGGKRRKVVPPGIRDLLNPVSLATW